MMPLELWVAYVFTSAVVLAIPGPTVLLVLSYSIAHGKRATLPVVAGLGLGDAVAITLSLIGLGTLLATSALWFTVIKWCGGLYLIYLGISMIRGARSKQTLHFEAETKSSRRLFTSAFVVTALNPKSIVFFIALLPQFISSSHATAPQLWILGITFVVMAMIGGSLYAIFASSMRRFLMSPRSWKIYGYCGGGLLCGAGAWALTAKRVALESP
ncbi:MAG: LysE family translocator [Pseudomonadota bacterium]